MLASSSSSSSSSSSRVDSAAYENLKSHKINTEHLQELRALIHKRVTYTFVDIYEPTTFQTDLNLCNYKSFFYCIVPYSRGVSDALYSNIISFLASHRLVYLKGKKDYWLLCALECCRLFNPDNTHHQIYLIDK